jgi:hypothetical protein
MHWRWEKCPYGWKGMYTHGDHGVPSITLEAVASHDRWIWRAFLGVPDPTTISMCLTNHTCLSSS